MSDCTVYQVIFILKKTLYSNPLHHIKDKSVVVPVHLQMRNIFETNSSCEGPSGHLF